MSSLLILIFIVTVGIFSLTGPLLVRAFMKGMDERLGEKKAAALFKHLNSTYTMNLTLEVAGFLAQRKYKEFDELNDWPALESYRIAFLALYYLVILMMSLLLIVPLCLEFGTTGMILSAPLLIIVGFASKLYLAGKISL